MSTVDDKALLDNKKYMYRCILGYNYKITQRLWWRILGRFTGEYKVMMISSNPDSMYKTILILDNKYPNVRRWSCRKDFSTYDGYINKILANLFNIYLHIININCVKKYIHKGK